MSANALELAEFYPRDPDRYWFLKITTKRENGARDDFDYLKHNHAALLLALPPEMLNARQLTELQAYMNREYYPDALRNDLEANYPIFEGPNFRRYRDFMARLAIQSQKSGLQVSHRLF